LARHGLRHHTPEQIIRKLAEGDELLNQDLAEACRQFRITESTWQRCRTFVRLILCSYNRDFIRLRIADCFYSDVNPDLGQ